MIPDKIFQSDGLERLLHGLSGPEPDGAAVLGIIRGHRGAIKVYSEPGRGSTFKMLIPALAGTGEPHANAAAPGTTAAETGPGERGTVLVVDDEETVRGMTRAMLEACGYRPHSSSPTAGHQRPVPVPCAENGC